MLRYCHSNICIRRDGAAGIVSIRIKSCDNGCATICDPGHGGMLAPAYLQPNQTRANGRVRVAVYARGCTMDATYFRDKAETCLRLAKGLSWNNPARGELMELAEEFQRQAEELDVTAGAEQRSMR
jgi:hypothetical protein